MFQVYILFFLVHDLKFFVDIFVSFKVYFLLNGRSPFDEICDAFVLRITYSILTIIGCFCRSFKCVWFCLLQSMPSNHDYDKLFLAITQQKVAVYWCDKHIQVGASSSGIVSIITTLLLVRKSVETELTTHEKLLMKRTLLLNRK